MVAHMARPRISLCCENFGEFLPEAKLRCRARPAVPEGCCGGQSNSTVQLYQARASLVKTKLPKARGRHGPFT